MGLPAHIHPHLAPTPFALDAGAVLLPAPLTRKTEFDDITGWMDEATTLPGVIRIGLAHGSVTNFGRPQLRPGTILMREHGGVRHTVTVIRDGFVWQDRTYLSLSAVARAITGTSWNGRRFFGLRMKPKADRREAVQ
jgi:hypothetical protein